MSTEEHTEADGGLSGLTGELCVEPIAWKYELGHYADHEPCTGVVLRKDELSPCIPGNRITWTPIYRASDLVHNAISTPSGVQLGELK